MHERICWEAAHSCSCDMELDENLPAEGGQREGLKRCTRSKNDWRCENWFSSSIRWKLCERCRAAAARNNKKRLSTEEGRKNQYEHQANYRKTPAHQEAMERHRATDGYKETKGNYQKSEGYRISKRKYRRSEKGKAAIRRDDRKVIRILAKSLRQMVTGVHPNPTSFPSRGLFASNEDAAAHFRSTYESWMNDDNHGPHVAGTDYNVRWHIGHRLPVAIFDGEIDADVNKCYNRRNLYAQCARRNLELRDHLNMSDEQLLELRDLWPAAANDSLHTLKGQFSKSVVVDESESDSEDGYGSED